MIKIYTANYCPYCEKAILLLFRKGVDFEVCDATDNKVLRESLTAETGCKTVPQIFVNDKFIGGFSDLSQLDNSGKLDMILNGVEDGEE
jgi:glutaredoxin 3|tara:strand:+ start:659 stop:925 length:267 start_codon:yes stop_codon:yes gene_type:complete